MLHSVADAGVMHSSLLLDQNSVHTESYDKFLSTYLRQTIEEAKPSVHAPAPQQGQGRHEGHSKTLVPSTLFRFTSVRLGKPTVSISKALEEGHTYTIPVYATLHIQSVIVQPPPAIPSTPHITGSDIDGDEDETKAASEDARVFENVKICDMPLMTFSAECLNAGMQNHLGARHPPGVFVIGGNFRYIPLTRTARTNYAITSNPKPNHWVVQIRSRCSSQASRSTATLEMSMIWSTAKSVPTMRMKLPYTDGKLSIMSVVLSLGAPFSRWLADFRHELHMLGAHCLDQCICRVLDDQVREIQARLVPNDTSSQAYPSIQQGASALVCSSSTTKSPIDIILARDVVPHLSASSLNPDEAVARSAKAAYLGQCLAVLCATSIGRVPLTDRDDLAHVRCLLPGQNLAVLFRMQFTQQLRRMVQTYRRSSACGPIHRADQVYRDNRLSLGIASAMATGNWSPRRQAVSHPFVCKNLSVQISQLARVSSSKPCLSGKQIAPRALKGTSFGYICAAETPDGDQVGLVCPLASLARVSPDTYSSHTDGLISTYFRDLLVPLPRSGDIPTDQPAHPLSVCARATADADEKSTEPVTPSDRYMYRVRDTSGTCIGVTWQPRAYLERLQDLRLGVLSPINPYLTLSIDTLRREVMFHGEEGRFLRPLVRVRDLPALVSALEAVRHARHAVRVSTVLAHVQFVCAAMLRSLNISPDMRLITPDHTHVEISHTACLGRLTMRLPMFFHNQGPRTIYGSGLIKSSIPSVECGPSSHARSRLWYSERELVHTRAAVHDQSHLVADGMNLIIAVLPLSTNVEDALVINQAVVDRGLLSSEEYKVYTHTITHKEAPSYRFACPAPGTPGRRHMSYDHLASNGLPKVGSVLGPGAVLIGRVAVRRVTLTTTSNSTYPAGSAASSSLSASTGPAATATSAQMQTTHEAAGLGTGDRTKRRKVEHTDSMSIPSARVAGGGNTFKGNNVQSVDGEFDTSLCLGEYEHGRVTRAEISVQANSTVATVELVRTMHIRPGDKLASRHSQKGVVGQLRQDVDMPFSIEDGTRPDVVVSPYCFPSRMTSGKLLEVLRGAAALATLDDERHCVDEQDCLTPGQDAIQHTKNALKAAGFSPSGTKRFIDGQTGVMIEASVFCGTAFYSKQDHIASNKARARGMGATQILTGQPCEGRKRGGGLKLGPMELGVLQAHGATSLLHERTVSMCAPFETPICNACGHIAEIVAGLDYPRCRTCSKADCVSSVELSKTSLLVMRELASTGIDVTLGVGTVHGAS